MYRPHGPALLPGEQDEQHGSPRWMQSHGFRDFQQPRAPAGIVVGAGERRSVGIRSQMVKVRGHDDNLVPERRVSTLNEPGDVPRREFLVHRRGGKHRRMALHLARLIPVAAPREQRLGDVGPEESNERNAGSTGDRPPVGEGRIHVDRGNTLPLRVDVRRRRDEDGGRLAGKQVGHLPHERIGSAVARAEHLGKPHGRASHFDQDNLVLENRVRPGRPSRSRVRRLRTRRSPPAADGHRPQGESR